MYSLLFDNVSGQRREKESKTSLLFEAIAGNIFQDNEYIDCSQYSNSDSGYFHLQQKYLQNSCCGLASRPRMNNPPNDETTSRREAISSSSQQRQQQRRRRRGEQQQDDEDVVSVNESSRTHSFSYSVGGDYYTAALFAAPPEPTADTPQTGTATGMRSVPGEWVSASASAAAAASAPAPVAASISLPVPHHRLSSLFASSYSNTPTMLPSNFQPGPYTVILGRGGEPARAVGNHRLKVFVQLNADKYQKARSRQHRAVIISSIIEMIRGQHRHGGAFVRYDGTHWWEVEENAAREKVSSAFRDYLHKNYKSSTKAKTERRKKARRQKQGGDPEEEEEEVGEAQEEQGTGANNQQQQQQQQQPKEDEQQQELDSEAQHEQEQQREGEEEGVRKQSSDENSSSRSSSPGIWGDVFSC